MQSRYYDPEVGRFINADGLVDTGTGLLGANMFAYCNNNPVNGYDPTGCYVIGSQTAAYEQRVMTNACGLGCALGLCMHSASQHGVQRTYTVQKTVTATPTPKVSTTPTYTRDNVSINGNVPNAKVNVTIDPNAIRNGNLNPNIQITDSYLITSRVDRSAILDIIIASPQFDSAVFKRGKKSWMYEWHGHNLLHSLGIFPANTATVDFDERNWIPWDIIASSDDYF